MRTIAVYGSLKAGKYNHGILEDALYLGTTTVKGTLYRVSSYPALIQEGENEYPAEIYEVDDRIYSYIHSMEIGAGYKEVEKMLEMDDGDTIKNCIVYYADTALEQRCRERYDVISSY